MHRLVISAAPLQARRSASEPREDPEAQLLALEHARLGRHLANVSVTPYQIDKYLEFHRQRELVPRGAFDGFLLRFSRSSTLGLTLADAYSGTLYRVCVLRMKLMLTLAILECSPPSFDAIDAPDPGGRWVYLRMLAAVLKAALLLGLACACLAPVHLWFAFASASASTARHTHSN